MNRKICDTFVIFILVLCCCISQITSNSPDSSATTALESQIQLASEENISDPIGALVFLFQKFLNDTGESLAKEMQNEFAYKQSTFPSVPSFLTFPKIPTLQPVFETARSYIKTGYRSYLLLNPEIKMSQCLVKHLYMRYPTVMRLFHVQNISKFIRRIYLVVSKFVNSILSGDIFSDVVKKRVESKVVLMTQEQSPTPQYPQYFPYQTYYQPWPTSDYNVYSPHRRSTRQVSRVDKASSPPLVDNAPVSNMDSNSRIDLTDRQLEREADQLFNIDGMFWKTFGIEENAMKKYSLSYCAKEYTTDVFRRFVKNMILS